jgi:FixJ family two-component response regulator
MATESLPRPSSLAPPSPTVFLIDDDPSFLTAAARLLRANGFAVQPFSSAREFLARRDPGGPGCVIADLQMPEMSGLDLQAALARTTNALPVIFLTGQGDIPATVRAMRDGAEDFLEKRAPRKKLIEAVRRALTRDALQRETRAKARDAQTRFKKLTEREREVLNHVLRGALNKQIAADLGICERTVKLHRTSITTKLGVQSVAEIARLAQEAGTFP